MLDLNFLSAGKIEHVCYKAVDFLCPFFMPFCYKVQNCTFIKKNSHERFCVLTVFLYILSVVDASVGEVEQLQLSIE